MPRLDSTFARLNLRYRSMLPQWYVDHLWETTDRHKNTPHVLWSGWVNTHGFPQHRMNERYYPLNGYLLYKSEGFQLAPDECIVAACGVKICMQTAHMKIIKKAERMP